MKMLLASLCLLAGTAVAEPAGTLRIASDATFAPFHFIDDDGEATGFDIELARAIAKHAGFTIEIAVVAYNDLFTGLDAGSHDLVAATTGITAARETRYAFSAPYFETCQAAVVRTGFGEPRHVIELAERRLAASGSGTSYAAMVETLAAVHLTIEEGQAQSLLAAGEIDAWVVDEFDAVAAARASRGELTVLPEPLAVERYGFVMAKGNSELKRRIDESLAALLASGQVAELKKKFGVRRDVEWPLNP